MSYTAIFTGSIEASSSSGGFTNLLSAGDLRQELTYVQHFNGKLLDVPTQLTTEVVFNLSFSRLRLLMLVADAPVQYSMFKDTGVSPARDSWSTPGRTHIVQLTGQMTGGDSFVPTQFKVRYAPVLVNPPNQVNFEVLLGGV